MSERPERFGAGMGIACESITRFTIHMHVRHGSAANLGEVHLAIDAGVLLKTGAVVLVCVRHAIAGADLGRLRQAAEQEILKLSAQESASRRTLAQLESGLIREFVRLQRA